MIITYIQTFCSDIVSKSLDATLQTRHDLDSASYSLVPSRAVLPLIKNIFDI